MSLQTSALEAFGLDSSFIRHFKPFAEDDASRHLGRVLLAQHETYRVATAIGEGDAVLSGRLRHHADGAGELPAVGDWVVLEGLPSDDGPARVHAVLPRRSLLSRQAAGARTREQPVAANVDVVLLIMGLDGDYNPRRLERLLVLAYESGARPAVVLNKADLIDDVGDRLQEIEDIALGVPVVAVSCLGDEDLSAVRKHFGKGETVALLGSSGVGKSTLTNRLLGAERMRVGGVREGDDRGRHTTTHRELLKLPGGGLLIDNPGLREIQLWAGDDALESTFEDIDALAAGCRFTDCGHEGEPGCAVDAAVDDGRLAPERLESYRKLERELRSAELRRDEAARRAADRAMGKLYRQIQSSNRKRKGG